MPEMYQVVQVVDDAFVAIPTDGWGWYLSNAGWVVGDDAILVVDTFVSERRSRWLHHAVAKSRAELGESSDTTVALTHAHGDHANGAYLFENDGARVIASRGAEHEACLGVQRFPSFLTETPWGEVRMPTHIEIIEAATTIELGGFEVGLLPCTRTAHTAGDMAATGPNDVLWAGDLVWNGVTPLSAQGSVQGWLDTLTDLATVNHRIIVPGHGPVGGRELLECTAEYLRWLREVALAGLQNETTAEQALSSDPRSNRPWRDWPCQERDVVNVMAAMAELSGQPLDLAAGVRAMVAAAGGPFPAPH